MVICKSDRMSDRNVEGRCPQSPKDSSAQWSRGRRGHWDFDPRGPRRDGEGAGARWWNHSTSTWVYLPKNFWFGKVWNMNFIFSSSWDDDPI